LSNKILFVTTRYPKILGSADSFTVYKLIEYFSKFYEIDLVCFDDESKTCDDQKKIQGLCNTHLIKFRKIHALMNVIFRFLNLRPMQVNYFYSKALHSKVENLSKSNEYIFSYYHLIRAAQYKTNDKSKSILAMQTSFTLTYERLLQSSIDFVTRAIYSIEKKLVTNFEKKIYKKFDLNLLISEKDLMSILNKNTHPRFFFSPHGIDVDTFSFKLPRRNSKKRIIFPANFSSAANKEAALWVLKEIIPRLRQNNFKCEVIFAGANPPKFLTEAAKHNTLITTTGFIKSMDEYIYKSAVLINPVRVSAGLQNKVLMGMSMGIPVVTTRSSIEGMNLPDELIFSSSNDATDFSTKIIEAFKINHDKKKVILLSAREYVEKYWTWEFYLKQLHEKIKKLF